MKQSLLCAKGSVRPASLVAHVTWFLLGCYGRALLRAGMIIGFGCFHFFNRCFQPFDRQGVGRDELDRQNFHRALRHWRA
jgi:hypothetical protein